MDSLDIKIKRTIEKIKKKEEIEILSEYERLFESRNKPFLKKIKFKNIAIKKPIEEIFLDYEDDANVLLELAKETYKGIEEQLIFENYSQIDLEEKIKQETNEIKNFLKTFENKKIEEEKYKIIEINKKEISEELTKNPLRVEENKIFLSSVESENVGEKAEVSIIIGQTKKKEDLQGEKSNGFPGNNHEINIIGYESYEFVGENDNKSSYGRLLDEEESSWFEYEWIEILDNDKVENKSFEYESIENKKIKFIKNNEKDFLKLELLIELKEEKEINEISIDYFFPNKNGANKAKLEKIKVINKEEKEFQIEIKNKSEEVFIFDQIKAKKVILSFSQKSGYETKIGYFEYEEVNKDKKSYEYATEIIRSKQDRKNKKIEGKKISYEDLGIFKDKKSNIMYYPKQNKNEKKKDLREIIKKIKQEVKEDNIEIVTKIMEAKRFLIGLKTIKLIFNEYNLSGEIITKPFSFEKPVKKIFLESKENEKNGFRYYVSINDAADWNEIFPRERDFLAEFEGEINHSIEFIKTEYKNKKKKLGIVESKEDVKKIWIKIEGSRDFKSKNKTPIIEDIKFKIEFGKENSNSYENEYDESEEIKEEILKAIDKAKEIAEEEQKRLEEIEDESEIERLIDEENEEENNIIEDDSAEDDKIIEEDEIKNENLKIEIKNKISSAKKESKITINTEIFSDENIKEVILYSNRKIIERKKAITGKERVFSFTYLVKEEEGSNILFEVVAIDSSENKDSDYMGVKVEEESTAKKECYELKAVIAEYYDEKEIKRIRISEEDLPYKIVTADNNIVNVGWNTLYGGAMFYLEQKETNPFVVASCGIVYLDYNQEEKTIWSESISTSYIKNVENEAKIIGDPSGKTYEYMDADGEIDYDIAPILVNKESCITLKFENNFNINRCEIRTSITLEKAEIPKVIIDEIKAESYIGSVLKISGKATDNYGLKNIKFFANGTTPSSQGNKNLFTILQNVYNENNKTLYGQKEYDFSFEIEIDERFSFGDLIKVEVEAENENGKKNSRFITSDNIPIEQTVIRRISPDISISLKNPTETEIDKKITIQGKGKGSTIIGQLAKIKEIIIKNEDNVVIYSNYDEVEIKDFEFDIPEFTYNANETVKITAQITNEFGQTDTAIITFKTKPGTGGETSPPPTPIAGSLPILEIEKFQKIVCVNTNEKIIISGRAYDPSGKKISKIEFKTNLLGDAKIAVESKTITGLNVNSYNINVEIETSTLREFIGRDMQVFIVATNEDGIKSIGHPSDLINVRLSDCSDLPPENFETVNTEDNKPYFIVYEKDIEGSFKINSIGEFGNLPEEAKKFRLYRKNSTDGVYYAYNVLKKESQESEVPFVQIKNNKYGFTGESGDPYITSNYTDSEYDYKFKYYKQDGTLLGTINYSKRTTKRTPPLSRKSTGVANSFGAYDSTKKEVKGIFFVPSGFTYKLKLENITTSSHQTINLTGRTSITSTSSATGTLYYYRVFQAAGDTFFGAGKKLKLTVELLNGTSRPYPDAILEINT
jgi:hypothetical protein